MSHMQVYCRLHNQLYQMNDEELESNKAEMLRNQADFHWRNMSEAERDSVRSSFAKKEKK